MTSSPAYSVTTATPADWDGILRLNQTTFHHVTSAETAEVERSVYEPDRTLLVRIDDGGELVGTAGIYSLTMTVPGGPRPVAGITWVSVLGTHRRRGILTQLMRRQLTDVHDGGEPVAALWASESAIYGRYGYGCASRQLTLTIPRSARALTSPVDGALQPRLVDNEAGIELAHPVYDAEHRRRPGMPARTTDACRRAPVLDPPGERNGSSPLRTVVVEDADGARGYARYSVTPKWEEVGPRGEVRVREVFALDPAAESAVWRYLLDLDLTAMVHVRNRPLDDPLLDLLADPRAAQPRLFDGIYVRLVDVDRALATRTYSTPIDLVLEVADSSCPWNSGRWRLSGDATGASCERTDAPADLALTATELGAVYLGGTSMRSLADAGRVRELRDGAVGAATTAFRHELAPWCPFVF